eukprot:jgi/Mesen1/1762/ME000014S01170
MSCVSVYLGPALHTLTSDATVATHQSHVLEKRITRASLKPLTAYVSSFQGFSLQKPECSRGQLGSVLRRNSAKNVRPRLQVRAQGGGASPMDMVAKGVTTIQNHLGPWSVQDMSLALAAMAKVTERQQPQAPGKAAEELAKDASFLAQAQHWRAHAEAIYGQSTAEWSLETNLPESSIVAVEWCPCNERLRPAYCISLDAPHGAVVVAVRGTSDITDMLVNAGASPEPFQGGHAHAGFVHASQRLLEEVEPHIEKAMEVMSQVQGEQRQQQQQQSPPRLVLVGHSLGCAVACMLALSLRAKYPGLRVWGLGPPACMSLELAQECAEFATCFIANHDLVPR